MEYLQEVSWFHKVEFTWLQLCQKNQFLQKKSCNPLSESVSVRLSLEEKEMRVFTIALALALTLTLFLYPERTKVATGRATSLFSRLASLNLLHFSSLYRINLLN